MIKSLIKKYQDLQLLTLDAHYDLRTEYAALSGYFGNVVSFRLTLLGFYLASIGLIVAGGWPIPIPVSILGAVLTISLYIFELLCAAVQMMK